MKHFVLTFLFLFTLITVGMAQEFTVKYESRTEIPDSLRELIPTGSEGSLYGVLYIKDSFINFSADIMGEQKMEVEITINTRLEKAVMLTTTQESKLAEKIDSNYQKKFINQTQSVEFVSETKTILGRQCLKAQYEGENGALITVWYVPGYEPPISIMGLLENRIPGIILQLVNENKGLKFIIEATSFVRKVENHEEVFDFTVPEGYLLAPEGLK